MAPYLVVQISDVHLTTSGWLPPGVRPRDNLSGGLRHLAEAGVRPDVFLLTGDLADTGEAGCYGDLAEIMSEAAASSGASVIFLPGNHDDRDAFCRSLRPGEDGGPVSRTYWRDGLRIIALDSTVPGEDYGHLDEQALKHLSSELATAAPDGTIVALHHPPIPSPIESMTRIALRNPEQLRDAIAGSDVRLVVCGHNHHASSGMLGAIPVWVCPAAAYQADPASSQVFRGTPGSAFSRIDITGSDICASVIPVPAVIAKDAPPEAEG